MPPVPGTGGKFEGIEATVFADAPGGNLGPSSAFPETGPEVSVPATEDAEDAACPAAGPADRSEGAELRALTVTGNWVLQRGHAATFPISASGAVSSLLHRGQ